MDCGVSKVFGIGLLYCYVIWITGLCWSSVLYLSSTLINCYLLNICIHVSAKGPNLLCLVSWQYWYLLHRTFSSIQILKIKSITYKGCVNDFRELPTRPGVPTINLPIVTKPGKPFLTGELFIENAIAMSIELKLVIISQSEDKHFICKSYFQKLILKDVFKQMFICVFVYFIYY